MSSLRGTGRKRAAEILEEFELSNPGFHPLRLLLEVAASPSQPWEIRVDCAKNALPYVAPKLQSMQVTGEDGGPICLQAIDSLRDDKRLSGMAEEIALALVTQGQIPAGSMAAHTMQQSEVIDAELMPFDE